MTPLLASSLDRAGLSSRKAAHVLTAAAISWGHDITHMNLSHSAINDNRAKMREKISKNLKVNLQLAQHLTVHWDGKLLPDITGKTKVERLPIIISGLGTEQLLSVPKLAESSGENQANVIIEALNEWNVIDRVKAMCFDTTSVNTGNFFFTFNHFSTLLLFS